MSEIRIPLHIASRIERRWSNRIEQEQSRQRQLQSKDVIHDGKNRAIPVLRRGSNVAEH